MKKLSECEACEQAMPMMVMMKGLFIDGGVTEPIASDMAASWAAFVQGLSELGIYIPESDGYRLVNVLLAGAYRAGHAQREVRPGDPAPLAGPASDEVAGVNGLGRPGSPESGG